MILVSSPEETIQKWLFGRLKSAALINAPSIGVTADGARIVAAACFTDYNGANIFPHLAIADPQATRTLLWGIADYCFTRLGCSRLTLMAESSNLAALKLHQKLGAIHEGTLVGAGKSGDDILLSRLGRDALIVRRLLRGKRFQFTRQPELQPVDSPARAGEHQPATATAPGWASQHGHPIRLDDVDARIAKLIGW